MDYSLIYKIVEYFMWSIGYGMLCGVSIFACRLLFKGRRYDNLPKF